MLMGFSLNTLLLSSCLHGFGDVWSKSYLYFSANQVLPLASSRVVFIFGFCSLNVRGLVSFFDIYPGWCSLSFLDLWFGLTLISFIIASDISSVPFFSFWYSHYACCTFYSCSLALVCSVLCLSVVFLFPFLLGAFCWCYLQAQILPGCVKAANKLIRNILWEKKKKHPSFLL